MTHAHRTMRTRALLAGLCALLAACVTTATRAGELVICADLSDSDLTRATYEQDATGRLTHFDIVTPDALWPAPGQPETPRFAAGESDVSPNLADHPGVRIDTLEDATGALRVIEFVSRRPDALPLDALRGSLVLHEAFQAHRAIGSLFISAHGVGVSVTAVRCRRFGSAAE